MGTDCEDIYSSCEHLTKSDLKQDFNCHLENMTHSLEVSQAEHRQTLPSCPMGP